MNLNYKDHSSDIKALIIFPPFVYSAVCGPHLAPAFLSGILSYNNISSQVCDFNIRLIHKVLSPEILEIVQQITGANTIKYSSSDRSVINWASKNNYKFLSEWPYQSLRRILRVVQKVLFESPSQIEQLHIDKYLFPIPIVQILYEAIIDQLQINKDTVIGLSVAFGEQFPEALRIAKIIRDKYQDIPMIIGGSQINLFHSSQIEQLIKYSLFDKIVIGNSENEISKIFIDATRNVDTEIHRCNPLHKNILVNLPTPQFNNEDIKLYLGNLLLPVLATKGCYWGKCTFCDYSKMNAFCNPSYITRPASDVLDEISYLKKQFKPLKIMLVSDGLSPTWYRKLCELAIANEISLSTWSYMLHSKRLNNDFFSILKQAGVASINFGTESTSNRILKLMNKMVRRNTIINNIRHAHNHRIDAVVNIIIDFPTMTFDECKSVADDIIDLNDVITILNPQNFELTVDTKIHNTPEKFEIDISNSGLEKTSHGYHSASFSRRTGMTDLQRKIMTSIFYKLAGDFRVKQRIKEMTLADNRILSFFIDRSAIIYRSDKDKELIVELVSLRQSWVINETEEALYRWLFANSSKWIDKSSLEKQWVLLGMADNYSCSALEWIDNSIRLGLIEKIRTRRSSNGKSRFTARN